MEATSWNRKRAATDGLPGGRETSLNDTTFYAY